jgi:VCBS repeat protein/hemolysin type calcium-binding protein
MAFVDILPRINIDPTFDTVDPGRVASLRTDMERIYNTPAGAAMIDAWLADAGHIIDIRYISGDYRAGIGTGRVELDPAYITNLSYITDHGRAVLHQQVGALAHELGHALNGTEDKHNRTSKLFDIASGDFMGDNVRFVNPIWQQLGLPLEVSYVAQSLSLHRVGYDYTNGAAIDGAVSFDSSGGFRIPFTSIVLFANNDVSTGMAPNKATNDLLIGGPSNNKLFSGDGKDFLFGGGGDDILNGGESKNDTAVYFGSALDYDIRLNKDGSATVKNVRGAKDAGADTLKNVEIVQFDGGQTYKLEKKGLTFQTDFALVIDTTGSMGSSIGSVKTAASALIDAAFAGGKADARIGVVGFKDTTIGEASRAILKFTDDDDFAVRKSHALTAINGIAVGGGGDLPETAFDGLRFALDGHIGDWRPGAGILRVALFTDAPAKDGALAGTVSALAHSIGATIGTHATFAGAGGMLDTFDLGSAGGAGSPAGLVDEEALLPFDPAADVPIAADPTTRQIQIFTIFTGPAGSDTAALESIAGANDGKFLVAPTNEELVKLLLEIINLPATPATGAPHDFNGDGRGDILWQNDNGAPGIWLMDGLHLVVGNNVGFNPGPSWKVKDAGDFDGDGKTDILWQNDNGTAGIWLMDGLTKLADGAVGFNPGPSWRIKDAADFNGDGKADILWQNDNGSAGIWLMDGLTRLADAAVGFNPGPAWKAKAAGDFDGDGKADILWQNDNGAAGIWLVDGLAKLADGAVGFNPGPSWKVKDAGDFNGDGKSDSLWQNDDGAAGIWLMDGLGVIADGAVGFNPGPSWKVKSASDYNGDGMSDILWQNLDGAPGIWLMDGLAVSAENGVGFNPGPSWNIVDHPTLL